ncbi:MAG: acyl transferase [Eudoraea sp.]|nr:acyl transferase [Eudoraea sp.]
MDPIRFSDINDSQEFSSKALEVFNYQYRNNKVYQDFCDFLGVAVSKVKCIENIPFLPIEFFRTKQVLSTTKTASIVFSSSGTTGSRPSKHHVPEISLYEQSFRKGFELFYGNVKEYCILALLPSYLEREGSSLVYMVNDLIQQSDHPESGFYLENRDVLAERLARLDNQGVKVLLIGVSFALLDMAETYSFQLRNTVIMETGGMKGRRKELIREELHKKIKSGFGVNTVHSEYGMTELLSQAYSKGNGIFYTPPWMKVLVRDTEDPLSWHPEGRSGGINIIDLANFYSCSFLATQDLGKIREDGGFEILGRFDHADVRGCNLMVL